MDTQPQKKTPNQINKEAKMYALIALCVGAIATIIGIVLFAEGMTDVAAYVIVGGLIFLCLGYRVYKDTKIIDNNKGCNYKNGTLIIAERMPDLARVIKIQDDKDAVVKYEPVKLHIGAATVGGVTTGGAYTTGGYNYVDRMTKNGKYKLVFNNSTIIRIQLNEEQYRAAQKSKIAKYLNDERQIQVIDKPVLTEAEIVSTLQTMQSSSLMNVGEAAKRGFPTHEKCVEILDWLCGMN